MFIEIIAAVMTCVKYFYAGNVRLISPIVGILQTALTAYALLYSGMMFLGLAHIVGCVLCVRWAYMWYKKGRRLF